MARWGLFASSIERKMCTPFGATPSQRKKRLLCAAQNAVFVFDALFLLASAVYCETTVNGHVAHACQAPCRTPVVFPYVVLLFFAHTAGVAVKWAVYVRKLSAVQCTGDVAWMEEHKNDALFANTAQAAFAVLILFCAAATRFCEYQTANAAGELVAFTSVFLLALTGNTTLHFAHCERLEWLHATRQGALQARVDNENDIGLSERLHIIDVEELSDYEP